MKSPFWPSATANITDGFMAQLKYSVGLIIGVPEVAQLYESALQCYPNPTSTTARLLCPGECANMQLTITDALGKLVSTERLVTDEPMISIGKLASGIYQLRAIDDQQRYLGRLLVE